MNSIMFHLISNKLLICRFLSYRFERDKLGLKQSSTMITCCHVFVFVRHHAYTFYQLVIKHGTDDLKSIVANHSLDAHGVLLPFSLCSNIPIIDIAPSISGYSNLVYIKAFNFDWHKIRILRSEEKKSG